MLSQFVNHMYHFFVPGAGDGPIISITGGDVNHIKNVLRMKPGETVVISNGEDRDFYCRIRELRDEEVLAEVLPEEVEDAELPARLTLYQGVPKSDKLEHIIQKSVELGAWRIVPVAMKRSVARIDPKKKKEKAARWNRISESAAKQCGRRIIPEVAEVCDMRGMLEEASSLDLLLVPYENAKGMREVRDVLRTLTPGMQIGIVIGPEGGLEPSEVEALQAAGAKVISLGRRILRTETAGPAALTLCMAALEIAREEREEHERNISG